MSDVNYNKHILANYSKEKLISIIQDLVEEKETNFKHYYKDDVAMIIWSDDVVTFDGISPLSFKSFFDFKKWLFAHYEGRRYEIDKFDYEFLKSYSLDGMGDYKMSEVNQIKILTEFGHFDGIPTTMKINDVLANSHIV